MAWIAGKQLQNGKYTILNQLAIDDFGVTYTAKERSGLQVIVKTPVEAISQHPGFTKVQEVFLRKVRQLRRYPHPKIMKIHDFFVEDELPCMVLEALDREMEDAAISLDVMAFLRTASGQTPSLTRILTTGVGILGTVNLLTIASSLVELYSVVPTPGFGKSTAWLANAFAKTNAKQANHSKAIAGQAIAPEGNTTPKLSQKARSRQQTEQTEQAERVAAAWLRVAYNRAAAKDFAGAVRALEQISPETAVYAYVPTKLAEYHWKKDIRAVWLLQQAYNCAAAGAFAEALNFLNQIPPDAQVFETARLKILEYTQKQKLLGAIY